VTSRNGRYRRRRLTQRQRVNSYDGPDTVETGRCLLGRHTGRGLARLGRGWGRQEWSRSQNFKFEGGGGGDGGF